MDCENTEGSSPSIHQLPKCCVSAILGGGESKQSLTWKYYSVNQTQIGEISHKRDSYHEDDGDGYLLTS